MYVDQALASQYGLNFNNPTVQMMCGAQSPHMFSPVGGQFIQNYSGYGYNPQQQYYQQPAIGCYSFGNPYNGYYQQVPQNMYSGPSNNPYLNYSANANPLTCSNPYYANTNNMDIHQQEAYEYEKLKQMYEEGKITQAQYAAYANAGIEHTTPAGTHVYAQNSNPQYYGWGGVSFGYNNQEYIQRQKAAQEAAYQNSLAFEIARSINNKFFGISDQETAQNQISLEQYERSLNERRRQEAEIELTYDMFAEQFKGAIYSDQKGYLSPRKEQAWRQFNAVWADRHKNIPENYTFKDFMENGVYADIIFDDMQYEMDRRRHNLVRMYDEIFVKNSISQLSPFYDPVGDYSLKGFKINKNELEIEVPPELVKQDYQNRKNKFFSTVFNNKTDNIPPDTAYLNERYSNPKPVNINQQVRL